MQEVWVTKYGGGVFSTEAKAKYWLQTVRQKRLAHSIKSKRPTPSCIKKCVKTERWYFTYGCSSGNSVRKVTVDEVGS